MPHWLDQINGAMADFFEVARLAQLEVTLGEVEIEYLPRPHVQPSRLPRGCMAIYSFFTDNECLKIGKVGPNSNARYTSQHYNAASSNSNLSASLLRFSGKPPFPEFVLENVGPWIKENTHRINILMPSKHNKVVLSLCETFLHARFKPRFEG